MSKRIISDRQADILTTALEVGSYKGEPIPWYVPIGLDPTWVGPLTGLIKRGLLKKHGSNMYNVTPEGKEALRLWQVNVSI